MDGPAVTAVGYLGMKASKRLVIPGARSWLLVEAVRYVPRRAVTGMVRRIQERANGL